MAKRALIAVHGMGVHSDGWIDTIREKLEEVAKRYEEFEGDPSKLWESLRLVPVTYDDILSKTIEKWRTASGDVVDFVSGTSLLGAPDLSWMNSLASADKDFFWTHVADVVIYRFFELERAAIQATVAKQIVEAVPKDGAARDFDACVVMAHSLGTSVSHDAMALLASQQIEGFTGVFGPLDARFAAVWMLANVSRFLQTDDAKVYESVVRGGARSSPTTNCGMFRSVSHELDPICYPKRFNPEGWSPRFNKVISIDQLRDWNVHGWEHYLDNPRVHVPLLNIALGRNAIGRSEAIRAVDAYDRFGGRLKTMGDVQAILREAKADLAELHELSDLGMLFEVARKLRKHWDDLKPIVEGLSAQLEADLEEGV